MESNQEKKDFEFFDNVVGELRNQTEKLLYLKEEKENEQKFLSEKTPKLNTLLIKERAISKKKEKLLKQKQLCSEEYIPLPDLPAASMKEILDISSIVDKDLNQKPKEDNFKRKIIEDNKIGKEISENLQQTSHEDHLKKIREFFSIPKKIGAVYSNNKDINKENKFYNGVKKSVETGFEKPKQEKPLHEEIKDMKKPFHTEVMHIELDAKELEKLRKEKDLKKIVIEKPQKIKKPHKAQERFVDYSRFKESYSAFDSMQKAVSHLETNLILRNIKESQAKEKNFFEKCLNNSEEIQKDLMQIDKNLLPKL